MAILAINHRTVQFNQKVLQLRTITSVAKYHGLRPLRFKWRFIIVGIVVALSGLGMMGNGQYGAGALVSLAAGAFVFYAIKRNLEPRDYWVLHLETAAGSRSLLASTDEKAIDDGVQGVTAAMEADVSYQHTVNISDSTIIEDSVLQNVAVSNMARTA